MTNRQKNPHPLPSPFKRGRETYGKGSLLRSALLCLSTVYVLCSFGAEVPKPEELILTTPTVITEESLLKFKNEGFNGVVLLVDENTASGDFANAAARVRETKMPVYCWIEVGRSPALANAHPEWMASIGMHDDWMKRFPDAKKAGQGRVTKAYPWVSIRYDEAFKAQVARVAGILKKLGNYDGVFLNDLQGAPASCGCGNLLCRWATDYHMPETGTQRDPVTAAADFMLAIKSEIPGKQIIPVWTTECEEVDTKGERADSTELCGGVGCAKGSCPGQFRAQFGGLEQSHKGAVGLLALHKELERSGKNGEGTAWIKKSAAYLQNVSKAKPWIVVQGYNGSRAQEEEARKVARGLADKVIVARTAIEQSYEPRVIKVQR